MQRKIKTKHSTFGWPRAFVWHGSILPKAILPTSILTLWALLVSILQTSPSKIFWPTSLLYITITSFVLSLLLGFRSNTAYERYWEGRRLWSNITVNTRNFSRFIWISADLNPLHDNYKERISALGLLLALLICIRNLAREDHSLILANGSLRKEFTDLFPPKLKLSKAKPFILTSPKYSHADILYLLNSFVDDLFRRKSLDAPQCNQLIAILNSLNEAITSIERILSTPMPLAYNLHLKQIMYLYLFMLPFQLVNDHGYVTILITAIATFVFVGVELIGSEIENPFGLDANDLPIDEFIADLEVELSELTGSKSVDMRDWSLNDESPVRNKDRAHNTLNDQTTVQEPVSAVGLSTLLGIVAISNRVIHTGNSQDAGLFEFEYATAALSADPSDVAVGATIGGGAAGGEGGAEDG